MNIGTYEIQNTPVSLAVAVSGVTPALLLLPKNTGTTPSSLFPTSASKIGPPATRRLSPIPAAPCNPFNDTALHDDSVLPASANKIIPIGSTTLRSYLEPPTK